MTGDLDPRQRAALDLADAFLVDPSSVDAPAWQAIREVLSRDMAAALVLRLTKFSRNKVRVALGVDLAEPPPEPVPYVPAARALSTNTVATADTLRG